MEYGFLGAGNMASAIIDGMIKSGVNAKEIGVFDTSFSNLESLGMKNGIVMCKSREEMLQCEVLILAVKPQILDLIINDIKEDIGNKKPLIISIAVGKTLDYLENGLGKDKAIVRVMPNINAKVLMATSGYCSNNLVSKEQEIIVENIFGSIGSVTKIPENMFSVFGVIAGSSPAFSYLYIDAIARAALKNGMPKKQALDIAAGTVLGSAKMILESEEHPWQLIDQVCSPGGTTIEGICSLQSNAFEATIAKAFDAVLEKDLRIQGKK